MNQTSRGGKLLIRLFHICFLPLWIILTVMCVLRHAPALYLTGAAALLVLTALLLKKTGPRLEKMSEGAFRRIVLGGCVLYFVLLALAGRVAAETFRPFSDAGTVYYSIAEILENGQICDEINEYTASLQYLSTSNQGYFLCWPNVFPLVPYMLPWMAAARALGADLYAFSGEYAAVLFNCLHIAAAALIGALLARREKGKAAGLLYLLLCMIGIPFYTQTARVYSNTLPLPWILLGLTFLLPKKEGESPLRLIPAGIFLGVAALLKGNLYVLPVAGVIWLLMRDEPMKKRLLRVLCLVLAVLLVLGCWSGFLAAQNWLDRSDSDDYRFPLTHWLMMGASDKGAYSEEDSEFTFSYPGVAYKKTATMDVFRSRMEEKGFSGTVRRIFNKLVKSLQDGLYSVAYIKRWIRSRIGTVFDNGLVPRLGFLYVLALYLMCAFSSALRCFRPRADACSLLNIAVFGTLLFFAFWELRSMYLLTLLPVLLLGAVLSLCDAAELLPERKSGAPRP